MDITQDTNTVYLFLFGVSILASFIDSIAGGGGLLTTPSMLLVGINPLTVLGTNKFQSSFSTFTSSRNYYVNGYLTDINKNKYFILSFIGSSAGTLMVSRLSDDILRTLIPILLISVAIFFVLNRQVKTDLSNYIVLLTPLIFLIGFYDGFFGPGTGSFFVMLFLVFKNQTLLESTATSKILNFASNFAAFIIFAVQGYVIWELGLIMAVGGISGAYLGSKSAIKIGDKLIRPILVVVSILLSLRILTS